MRTKSKPVHFRHGVEEDAVAERAVAEALRSWRRNDAADDDGQKEEVLTFSVSAQRELWCAAREKLRALVADAEWVKLLRRVREEEEEKEERAYVRLAARALGLPNT